MNARRGDPKNKVVEINGRESYNKMSEDCVREGKTSGEYAGMVGGEEHDDVETIAAGRRSPGDKETRW